MVENRDDVPEGSDSLPTLAEMMAAITEIVSGFRPDLAEEINRVVEEQYGVEENPDLKEVVGTVQSVLEASGVDASPLLESLAEMGLMGAASEIPSSPAGVEDAERDFRVFLVGVCRGVLTDEDL